MKRSLRKTSPRVRNGKVARKNRSELSNHYMQVRQCNLTIDRRRPGPDYRHFLSISDVKRFVTLIPGWRNLSVGLDAIVLAEGSRSYLGWHWDGIVAVCAWEREMAVVWDCDFVDEHAEVLDRLGVECEPSDAETDLMRCFFDAKSIKGFQLMHVLLHELGHHHDRMTTKSRRRAARGEKFAERFSFSYAEKIWDTYLREFGW